MRKFGERKVWLVSLDEEGQLKPYEVKEFPLCKLGVIKHLLTSDNIGSEHVVINKNRYHLMFDNNNLGNLKNLLIAKCNNKNVVIDMEESDYPVIRYARNKYLKQEKTMNRIHTSESVTSGHPDKIADIISDSILDECLKQDKSSRTAVEVMLTKGKVLIAGEVTTKGNIDYIAIARKVIKDIGYDINGIDFECRIHTQSKDIAQAVNKEEQGAGDQGIMYGYATDETLSYMPLSITLAHRLTSRLEECRKEGIIQGILPDGKAQVSVEYMKDRLHRIKSVVVSSQHTEDKDFEHLKLEIKKHVIDYVFQDLSLDEETEVLINPSRRFVEGGFDADTGLTGRKIIVDTYGGVSHHGGGAFSGKDCSKVDRSGAYMARYIAKNIVAAGLAEKCEVVISYAIGKAEPTSLDINTFYTGIVSEKLIKEAVLKVFDLRPKAIIEKLNLLEPIYAKHTASGGHFGKQYLMWEQLDKVDELKNQVLKCD